MAVKPSERIMVPLPSHSIVPIEDMHKAPVLQTHQLGIDFGGLTAVNNLNLAIGPSSFSTPLYSRIAPQPPGPGLPEQAPSVYSVTVFILPSPEAPDFPHAPWTPARCLPRCA